MKNLIITTILITACCVGIGYGNDIIPKHKIGDTYIVGIKKHDVKCLSNAINDLIKEKFMIMQIQNSNTRLRILVEKTGKRIRSSRELRAIERKHDSITQIEPNLDFRIDE